MSSEERNAFGAIIASLITLYFFGAPIWQSTQSGGYEAADGLSLWARDVLWLMGGGIVITIIVMIAFHIVLAIVTGNENPEMVTDERDHMITRRGTLATLIVCSGAFIIAVIGLATGWSAVAGFNTILAGMFAGAFASELVRIVSYRLGL